MSSKFANQGPRNEPSAPILTATIGARHRGVGAGAPTRSHLAAVPAHAVLDLAVLGLRSSGATTTR